ncbi:MAG: endonuclease domain-containing protein [Candidatus Taylorbacteria bacterium]|nr:endonuclease domain-containing protein [Candidatus Taylorbacteria bacterium]
MHNQSYLKNIRRELRQQQTRQEKILWSFLRNRKQGLKFKRQESIGDYIIDFYCREKKLIIELDGEIHKNQSESDLERTRFLESLGFKVLRFWNNQIETEIEKVLEKIQQF